MFDVITIGASAGGIKACRQLFSMLPTQFSWPILLVQHIMPSQGASGISSTLEYVTEIPAIVAKEGEIIRPRHIYIAPSDRHMMVTKKRTLQLSKGKKVMYSRPSIDVLFKSAAEVFHNRVIGIILTGANKDGAEGLAAIKDHGGFTIVQDPGTAFMRCMPDSAIAQTDSDTVLSPVEIGGFLKAMWLIAHPPYSVERKKHDVTR